MSKDALRPVVLNQVLAATQSWSGSDAPWFIDGHIAQQIIVVASVIVEGVKPETHMAWYRLEDGTNGRLVTALRFIDDSDNAHVLPQSVDLIPRHRYVRIVGRLTADKVTGGAMIRVDALHVVEDDNELLAHFLRAQYATLCYERGPPPPEVLQSLAMDNEVPTEPAENNTADRSEATHHASTSAGRPPTTPRAPATPQTRHVTPPPTAGPSTEIPSPPTRQPAASDVGLGPTAKRPVPPPNSNATTSSRTTAHNPFPTSSRTPTTPRKPSRFCPAESSPFTPGTQNSFRRLSTRDPLSDLNVLQRAVLLEIMEGTQADPERGIDVVTLAMNLQAKGAATQEQANEITNALDFLMDEGHIVADEEAMNYRTVDLKGKRPAYNWDEMS